MSLWDLHMHSTISDGGYSPCTLVKKCAEAGLQMISLTDHDSTGGLEEAKKTADESGIICIPGLELSTEIDGQSIDILGYGIQPTDKKLQQKLQFHRSKRHERMEKMIEKCAQSGVAVSMADVEKHITGYTYSRPHLAKALIEAGYAADMQEAFAKYVGEGKPCYAPKEEEMHPLEAMQLIREAGGVSIIAHPVYYQIDEKIMDWLTEGNLDGVEIFHRDHEAQDRNRFEKITAAAEKLTGKRFFRTGGTDFHHESFGRKGEVIGCSPLPESEAEFLYYALEGR